MTLVQTLLTEDLVVLVADRRLTWPDGSVTDDNFTKIVLWRDCFTVAFSGIARINSAGTKSTSEWIAEVLADCRLFEEGLTKLQQRASAQLASIAALPNKWPDLRLCITVAGFDFRRYPRFALVSNFLPGGPYPTDPTKFGFYNLGRPLSPGARTAFATAGAALEDWQEDILGRTVPRTLRQRDGITRAARIMVALQRKVADKESSVGRDAMCVVIPRERKGLRGIFGWLAARKLHGRNINFCYFEDGAYLFKQLGPHIATGNGRAIADFYGVADANDPLYQTVSMRTLLTTSAPHWADVPPDLIPGLENLSARYAAAAAGNEKDSGTYGFGIGF